MPKLIAIALELALCACVLWALSLLSTLLHELGHALGYLLATGDSRWHIRVGSEKTLLDTKRLTVRLLPFDGCFTPSEPNTLDTKAKLITVLAGGPAASLVAVAALLLARHGGITPHSDLFAPSAIEFFLSSALSINLFILTLSVIPTHYFLGEIRGTETDGLQILKALRDKGA